jgi:hypothetical protein
VIGSGEKTWTGGKADANNITAQRFAVSASTQGTIGDIRIKVTGNVNLKVAIYDDDGVGGAPRTLLAYSAGTACISGWNTILLNIQVALTTGNYYLAVITQASNMVWQLADAGAISYYAAANYADAFPNPVPALSFIARDYAIAGWGLKVV